MKEEEKISYSNASSVPNGALAGLTVVDCSQVLAGPFCSMLLADMGADVIKVEKPAGGDDMRRWGPPFVGGESAAFMAVNRNKRSIALDIKSEDGRAALRKLAERADVFIENYRLGSMERNGFGYAQLAERNPRLVYCSISGFGRTGPYAERAGYDLVAQGMSGLMSITGHPDNPPAKVGVPMADLNAGMFAALGIVSACFARQRTGKGQFVDISLMDSAVSYVVWESAIYFSTGQTLGPLGSSHRLTAPYQAVRCSDGYITIGAPNQTMWERVCAAIDRRELIDDDRFRDNGARMEQRDALEKELEKTFATNSREFWLKALSDNGVAAGPIFNVSEVWGNEQMRAREMDVPLSHPAAGTIRNIGTPIKMSDTPGGVFSPAPTLGQHTKEVLEDLKGNDAQ